MHPMHTTTTIPCAVVGGGLAGKTCALALARAGLDVTLLGAAPARPLPAEGYAQRLYALNAASRQLLDELSVWAQMPVDRVQPVAAMHIAADGARLAFTAHQARADALAWIVESDAVETTLDLALRFESRVRVQATQVDTIERDGDAWRLTPGDGASPVRATLLIGADGQNSQVRQAAGIATQTRDYHQRGIVANLRCAAPHGGVAFQCFGAHGVIALLPLAPLGGVDRVSLVWSAPDALAQELLALAPEALAARVQQFLPDMDASHLGPLQADGLAASWPLRRELADAVTADSLVLVGDAAHRVHPLAGQGLNLGLQDVHVLAGLIAARNAGTAPADARLLRRYARARAEQVTALATATDLLARLYEGGSPVPAPLRALGLRAVNALPPVKQLLARYASGLPYLD